MRDEYFYSHDFQKKKEEKKKIKSDNSMKKENHQLDDKNDTH